jgi:RNA polymerase sigma factor (sigma-70 family)
MKTRADDFEPHSNRSSDHFDRMPDPHGNPEELMLDLEEKALWRQRYSTALKRVAGKRRREVFKMKLDGMMQAQIAEALGISENTVEQHLAKARAMFIGERRAKKGFKLVAIGKHF